MSKWDELTMAEKAEMMKVAVRNGITNLVDIRAKYNEFAEGGNIYAGTPIDNDLIDFLIKEEGFLAHPKDIGDGKITLGSGLTAKKWHDLYKKRGNKWSAEDNRKAVAEEVANRRKWAEKNVPNWDTLPESSQKALLAYKYNYDFTKSNSPKLFKALSDSNLYEAARQMDATSKDPQFKKGLMARRKREQNWFLSDVAPRSVQDYQMPVITEQPVSTMVVNPFVPKMEYTQRLPIMVPDEGSYITAHEVSPSEQRATEIQNTFNAVTNLQRFLKAISIPENPVPEYKPKNAPYVVMGLGGPLVEAAMNEYKKGGSIHISPSKKGTFTAAAKKHGKSVQAFASQVLAHPENYSPAMRKKANFARNASKWHGLGGNLFSGEEESSQQMNIAVPDATYIAKTPIFLPLARKEYDWEDAALNRDNQVYSNYEEAKDETMPWTITKIRNAARWVKDNIYEGIPSGVSNCTLTTTQWIDPNNPIAHAKSIHKNPEKYNYTKIDSTEAIPGNILITRNPNDNSYHTMLITGLAGQDSTATFDGKIYPVKRGEPLLTYSKGGHDNSFIRRNIPLSAYTPNSEGKIENLFYRYNYPREVFLPEITVTPKRKKK